MIVSDNQQAYCPLHESSDKQTSSSPIHVQAEAPEQHFPSHAVVASSLVKVPPTRQTKDEAGESEAMVVSSELEAEGVPESSKEGSTVGILEGTGE